MKLGKTELREIQDFKSGFATSADAIATKRIGIHKPRGSGAVLNIPESTE